MAEEKKKEEKPLHETLEGTYKGIKDTTADLKYSVGMRSAMDLYDKAGHARALREMSHEDFQSGLNKILSDNLISHYKKSANHDVSGLLKGVDEATAADVKRTLSGGLDEYDIIKTRVDKGDDFTLDDILGIHEQKLQEKRSRNFNYHIQKIDPEKRKDLLKPLEGYLGKGQTLIKDLAANQPEAVGGALAAHYEGGLNKKNLYQTGFLKQNYKRAG